MGPESISNYLLTIKHKFNFEYLITDNDDSKFLSDPKYIFTKCFTDKVKKFIKNDQKNILGIVNNIFLDFDLFTLTLASMAKILSEQRSIPENTYFRHKNEWYEFSLDFNNDPVIKFKQINQLDSQYFEVFDITLKKQYVIIKLVNSLCFPYSWQELFISFIIIYCTIGFILDSRVSFLSKPLTYLFIIFILCLMSYPIINLYFKLNLFFNIKKENQLKLKFTPTNWRVLDIDEYSIIDPQSDMFNFKDKSAIFYYKYIHNRFYPHQGRIIILNGWFGIGKTSFINLLINKVNNIDYYKNRKLFRNIISNEKIYIIKLSAAIICEYKKSSTKFSNKFLTYIGNNLASDQKKLFMHILSSVKELKYNNLAISFTNIANQNKNIYKLKQRILFEQRKSILIIEDLDRLTSNQLKIVSDVLWYIKEIPLLTTILPMEETKLKISSDVKIKLIDSVYDLNKEIPKKLAMLFWKKLIPENSIFKIKLRYKQNTDIYNIIEQFVLQSIISIFSQIKLTIREFKKIVAIPTTSDAFYLPDCFVHNILKLREPQVSTIYDLMYDNLSYTKDFCSPEFEIINMDNLNPLNSLFYIASIHNHLLSIIRCKFMEDILLIYARIVNHEIYLYQNQYASYFFCWWVLRIPYIKRETTTFDGISPEQRIEHIFSSDVFDIIDDRLSWTHLIGVTDDSDSSFCFIVFVSFNFLENYAALNNQKVMIDESFKNACKNFIVLYISYIMFKHHIFIKDRLFLQSYHDEPYPFYEYRKNISTEENKYENKFIKILCKWHGKYLISNSSLFSLYHNMKLILGSNFDSLAWIEAFKTINKLNPDISMEMIVDELNGFTKTEEQE